MLFLGGCASFTAAVERGKSALDDAARISVQGPCLMTVGSYHRTLTGQKKLAVDVLCGGDGTLPDPADPPVAPD